MALHAVWPELEPPELATRFKHVLDPVSLAELPSNVITIEVTP
jgi:hypothetical protein